MREAAARDAKKSASKLKAKESAVTAASSASAATPVAVVREDVFVARELAAAVNSPVLIAKHKAVCVVYRADVCQC